MVGVPGRSKGCNTCIQRRVRCDGQRPDCGNCLKMKLGCTGYKRTTGFVLYKNASPIDQEKRELNDDGAGITVHGRWRRQTPREISVAAASNRGPKPHAAESAQKGSDQKRSRRGRAVRKLFLSPENAVSPYHVFRQQFWSIFLDYHVPSDLVDRHNPESKKRNFMLLIADRALSVPALETAVAAVSVARAGRQNGDEALTRHSHALYVRGLHQLRQAIADPNTCFSDETLAACQAFSMYEVCESPDGMASGYVSHQDGALRILLARGPEAAAAPTSQLGHCLFLSIRAYSFVQGLSTRKASPLSRPEWQNRPFQGSWKDPFDTLLDIIFVIPPRLGEADDLARDMRTSSDRQVGDRFRQLISQCWEVEEKFEEWYRNFQRMWPGPMYTSRLSELSTPLDTPATGKVFPISFDFTHFILAPLMVVYWVGMTMNYSILYWAYRRLDVVERGCHEAGQPAISHHQDTVPGRKGKCSAESCAEMAAVMSKNICQCVEYLNRDKLGAIGTFSLLPPLLVPRHIFQLLPGDWRAERAWVDYFIGQLESKGNYSARILTMEHFLPD